MSNNSGTQVKVITAKEVKSWPSEIPASKERTDLRVITMKFGLIPWAALLVRNTHWCDTKLSHLFKSDRIVPTKDKEKKKQKKQRYSFYISIKKKKKKKCMEV